MTEVAVFTSERRAGTPNGRVFVREIPGDDPSEGCEDDEMTPDPAVSLSRPPLALATGYLCFSPTLGKNGPLTNRCRRLSSIICTRPRPADELNRRSLDAE